MAIRQPIVTIAGHVDHGKTSILDSIRKTCIAKKEAGSITQKISFTIFPAKNICESCAMKKENLQIPGFLFIDTPGHAAFTNLRKRGGSLADLAVLVIDINEGIMPQTGEVLQILKLNKTPFIVALNKIDNVHGWQKGKSTKESIESLALHTKEDFEEKLYTLIGALNSYGFNADLFYNIEDFTKKLALVPCSAKTGEGISDIILMLCGLSQKFLKKQLELGKKAKGVILEIKKDKASYIEAIIYDGELKKDDYIQIASFNIPVKTRIRVLEEAQSLSAKFKPVNKVKAATGVRMQLTGTDEILPGMPFICSENEKDINEMQKEITDEIETDEQGIIVKADSLGSLEALLTLLKQANIQVLKAGIGKINKQDVAIAMSNELDNRIVLGFNTEIDEEAQELKDKVKILTDEVIYKLIENLQKYQEETKKQDERKKLLELGNVCKLEILHQYIFRNSSPAIFGVKLLAGNLIKNIPLIDNAGKEIARVKALQKENKSVEKASLGDELAISLPGTNFERQLKESKYLYSDLSEYKFRQFKENKSILSQDEIKALQEIAQIKRKQKVTWGI